MGAVRFVLFGTIGCSAFLILPLPTLAQPSAF
jgi:hypothetical protein